MVKWLHAKHVKEIEAREVLVTGVIYGKIDE